MTIETTTVNVAKGGPKFIRFLHTAYAAASPPVAKESPNK